MQINYSRKYAELQEKYEIENYYVTKNFVLFTAQLISLFLVKSERSGDVDQTVNKK